MSSLSTCSSSQKSLPRREGKSGREDAGRDIAGPVGRCLGEGWAGGVTENWLTSRLVSALCGTGCMAPGLEAAWCSGLAPVGQAGWHYSLWLPKVHPLFQFAWNKKAQATQLCILVKPSNLPFQGRIPTLQGIIRLWAWVRFHNWILKVSSPGCVCLVTKASILPRPSFSPTSPFTENLLCARH